jgi:hypothetical protein
MSTVEQQIPRTNSALLSANTTAQSILSEHRDRRYEAEDLRERRFGYNPGFIMEMDPIHSGLQLSVIEPGKLILFETGPISRQNLSVDKDDRTPPDKMSELLAGEGLMHVYQQNAQMGFRELRPLRGLSNERAVDLFSMVHPPLNECVQAGVIPECIYGLESCITCRFNFLQKLKAETLPGPVSKLFDILKESVTVGRAKMAADWRTWVGEVAGVEAGTNRRMALGELSDGHLYFMRQLHERTPREHELDKIKANAEAQANVMEDALGKMTQTLGQSLQQQTVSVDERAAMEERMRLMEEQIARMQQSTAVDNPSAESGE